MSVYNPLIPAFGKVSVSGETSISATGPADTLTLAEKGVGATLTSSNTVNLFTSLMIPLGAGTKHGIITAGGGTTAAGFSGGSSSTIYYVPIHVGRRSTFTKLGIYVTTASDQRKMYLAIYTDSNGRPASLIQASSEITQSTSTGAYEYTLSPSLTLTVGPYWLAWLQNGSSTAQYRATPGTVYTAYLGADVAGGNRYGAFTQTYSYASPPSTVGTLTAINQGSSAPLIYAY